MRDQLYLKPRKFEHIKKIPEEDEKMAFPLLRFKTQLNKALYNNLRNDRVARVTLSNKASSLFFQEY